MRSDLVAACIFAAQVGAAYADEITLIAPGGIRAPIQKMIPDFERRTGHTVKATFGSGNGGGDGRSENEGKNNIGHRQQLWPVAEYYDYFQTS